MPKLQDLNIPAAFGSYFEPNEQLKNWAYGFKRPPMLLVAIIGGVLAAMVLASLINIPIVMAGAGVFAFLTWFALFIGLMYAILFFPVTRLGKTYVVGLTDKPFLVLLIKTPFPGKPDVSAKLVFTDYPLQKLSAETSIGRIQSSIKLGDSEKPFEAQFAHAMNGNREQLEAIAAALKHRPRNNSLQVSAR
jgi:hypothetical protein